MSGTPISEIRGGVKNSDLVNNILDNMDGGERPPQLPPGQGQQPMPPNGMPQMQQREQYENYDDYDDLSNMSFTERLMLEGKLPLVVAILIILMNFDVVGKTIMKYLPKFIAGNQVDIATLAIKGLIGAIAFYLIRRFLLPYA